MADPEWQDFFPPTVGVRHTEEYGRGLYASENISRGTEILKLEPFVYVMDTNQREKYCNFCLIPKKVEDCFGKTERELKMCGKCRFVWYCGKECQTNDWFLHKKECKLFTEVKAIHEQPLWWDTASHQDYTAYVRLLIRMQKKSAECARKEIDLLCPNHCDLDGQYTEHTGVKSRRAIQYLKRDVGIQGTEEELLLLHCKINVNSYSIRDQQHKRIGCGVYTGPSLLNHSCDPNCEHIYEGRRFVLRAVKPIQPGEQLWNAYVPLLSTYKQRQAELWKTYRFHCQCHRCLSECQKDSPYHIMYATTGDVSNDEKESMMEEGFSTIKKAEKMVNPHAIIYECQKFLKKYKDVLHPGNILNIEINNTIRAAYAELGDRPKMLEATKRVCDAYKYCPFKDSYYDYGSQLLDLGYSQMQMRQFGHSLQTITEAIAVLSVLVGPDHYLTGLAKKIQLQCHLSHDSTERTGP